MAELCVIKINSKGMQLILDSQCDYMDLVKDVCFKFLKSKEFFGKRDIILELKGRQLAPDEVRGIVEAIQLNSDLTIKLLREGDDYKEPSFAADIDRFYYEKALENAKIIKGDVNSDLNEDLSLLILGDIKREATVKSKGSVIVLGKIYGTVVCGKKGDNASFVIASDFINPDITLCGLWDEELFAEKTGFFKKKDKKGELKCVCVFQNELVLEPLDQGILFS